MPRRAEKPRPHRYSSWACVSCQKRKTRCYGHEGGTAACTYCQSKNKTCSFEQPPKRTPLTRKNLESAERNTEKLKSLIRTLNPDLDIEAILGSQNTELFFSDRQAFPNTSSAFDFTRPSANRYDWHETPRAGQTTDEIDGMAIIPNTNAGYLGQSSGSSILQEVATMLPAGAALYDVLYGDHVSPSTSRDTSAVESSQFLDPHRLAVSVVANNLLDVYFLRYNCSYPILHEQLFRSEVGKQEQMASIPVWHATYYMTLAIGSWLHGSETNLENCPYYSAAKPRMFMHILEAGNVHVVQALLLMGNYLQKRNRPNTAYNLIGLAHRIVFGIGLHHEDPDGKDTMLYEHYRRLFWVMYCFDSGFGLTTGRPISTLEEYADVRQPQNINDQVGTDLNHESPVPPPVDLPTVYSAIIFQASLARIANQVHREVFGAKASKQLVEYQLADMIAQQLDSWRNDLPAFFTASDVPAWFLGPRSIVLWKEQNLRMLLWRGTKPNHPYFPHRLDAQTLCLNTTVESIHTISSFCMSFRDQLHQGISWYATYFLFQATLVLGSTYLDKKVISGGWFLDRDDWNVTMSMAKDCLELLTETNSCARSCLDLVTCIQESIAPVSAGVASIPDRIDALAASQPPVGMLDTYSNCGSDFNWTVQMNDAATDPTLRMIIDETMLGLPSFLSYDIPATTAP